MRRERGGGGGGGGREDSRNEFMSTCSFLRCYYSQFQALSSSSPSPPPTLLLPPCLQLKDQALSILPHPLPNSTSSPSRFLFFPLSSLLLLPHFPPSSSLTLLPPPPSLPPSSSLTSLPPPPSLPSLLLPHFPPPPPSLPFLTFCASAKLSLSTMAGFVLGIAPIRVTPPARAAAVQDAKSSLWVWPGSLT